MSVVQTVLYMGIVYFNSLFLTKKLELCRWDTWDRAIDQLRGHFSQILVPESHLIQLPRQVILHQNITHFSKLRKKYINAHLPDTYYFIYESVIKVYSCAFTGMPIRLNLLVLWDGTVYKTMLCNINKPSESCTSVTSLVPFGSLRLTAMLCRKDHECRIYGFTVCRVTNNCTGRYILFTTFLFLLTLRK